LHHFCASLVLFFRSTFHSDKIYVKYRNISGPKIQNFSLHIAISSDFMFLGAFICRPCIYCAECTIYNIVCTLSHCTILYDEYYISWYWNLMMCVLYDILLYVTVCRALHSTNFWAIFQFRQVLHFTLYYITRMHTAFSSWP